VEHRWIALEELYRICYFFRAKRVFPDDRQQGENKVLACPSVYIYIYFTSYRNNHAADSNAVFCGRLEMRSGRRGFF
jgi:hypothetical protein